MSKRNKYLTYMFVVRCIAYFYISFMLTHIFGHNVATVEYWALYVVVIALDVISQCLGSRIGYIDGVEDCTRITIEFINAHRDRNNDESEVGEDE